MPGGGGDDHGSEGGALRRGPGLLLTSGRGSSPCSHLPCPRFGNLTARLIEGNQEGKVDSIGRDTCLQSYSTCSTQFMLRLWCWIPGTCEQLRVKGQLVPEYVF